MKTGNAYIYGIYRDDGAMTPQYTYGYAVALISLSTYSWDARKTQYRKSLNIKQNL